MLGLAAFGTFPEAEGEACAPVDSRLKFQKKVTKCYLLNVGKINVQFYLKGTEEERNVFWCL